MTLALATALLGTGCKKKDAPAGAAKGSGSAVVGSGSGSAAVGSAAVDSGSGSAAVDSGSAAVDSGSAAVGSGSDAGSGSGSDIAPAGDAKNPLSQRQLDSLNDPEAQKTAAAVATALVANDVAAFVAQIGPAGYTHAGKKMTADEIKAAAGTSLRTWLGWDCAADPKSCKWNPKLDGIDMSLGGDGTSVITFGLTPDGTWPLTGDKTK